MITPPPSSILPPEGEGSVERREGAAAKITKVWLHPRMPVAAANDLARELDCRLQWKGAGVALVPCVKHAQAD